jgi:hypothetical protein
VISAGTASDKALPIDGAEAAEKAEAELFVFADEDINTLLGAAGITAGCADFCAGAATSKDSSGIAFFCSTFGCGVAILVVSW